MLLSNIIDGYYGNYDLLYAKNNCITFLDVQKGLSLVS